MKRLVHILLLVFWTTALSAARDSIRVVSRAEGPVASEPKKIVTSAFLVENNTASSVSMVSQTILPRDWKVISQDQAFDLSGSAQDTRLVSFLVPQFTKAGDYAVIYRVQDRDNPLAGDADTVTVTVMPFREIEVESIDIPKYVIAGEPFEVAFALTNKCNTDDRVDVEVTNNSHFPMSSRVEALPTHHGKSKKIIVTVKSDPELTKPVRSSIYLTAMLHPDQGVQSRAVAQVNIIPKKAKKVSRYHKLPLTLGVRHVTQWNQRDRSGFQFDLSGRGAIDQAGNHQVRLRLRGPDIFEKSIFAQHDEYYLSYSSNRYQFHVGDRSFSLSQLTEFSRYGRGVEGGVKLNQVAFGAYYQESRWRSPSIRQTAASLRVNPTEQHQMAVFYLRKDTQERIDDIFSMQVSSKPYKNAEIEAEYAVSPDSARNRDAFRLKYFGRHDRLVYMVNLVSADPDFAGYYHDTRYAYGHVMVYPFKNLGINATVRQDRQNFEMDTTRYAAPLTESIQLGARYRWGNSGNLHAEWVHRSSVDRMETPKFDYREWTLRLRLNQSFKKFSFSTLIETGKTLNHLLNTNARMEQYQVSLHFRPTPHQSYRGYINYDKNARYTGEVRSQMTLGADISLALREKTLFHLSFQNQYTQEEYYRNRDVFECRLDHLFGNKHKVSIRARQTLIKQSMDLKDTAILVEYTLPLGIPVGTRHDAGVVQGNLVDDMTGAPQKNVVIRLNQQTAVTDGRGRFAFRGLTPGTYFMSVDRIASDLKRIPDRPMPMKLDIQQGSEIDIPLGLTRSAELSGAVMLHTQSEDASGMTPGMSGRDGQTGLYVLGSGRQESGQTDSLSSTPRGLANILVEVVQGEDVQRRLTDHWGRFAFEELRPGRWNMKVYEYNLPRYHHLEPDTLTVNLAPGSKEEVAIRVLPTKRRIRIIEDGGILKEQDKPQPEEAKPVKEKTNQKKIKTLKERYNLGLQYFDQKHYQDALKTFSEMLKVNPTHQLASNCQYWIGECYNAMGEYGKAIEAFQAVLQYASSYKHEDALLMQGLCFTRLDDRAAAREQFQHLLNAYPDSEHKFVAERYLGML